jgi:hypothetical protein
MNKLISLLVILLSFNGILKAASTDAAHLLGQWAGVLPVPGGSRQVTIFVSQEADGTPTALLRIDAHRLDNSPMRVRSNADSISFVADQTGCRFVALPVAEGQRLRGTWQQPGFRTVLVLDHVAGTSTAPVPAAAFGGAGRKPTPPGWQGALPGRAATARCRAGQYWQPRSGPLLPP